MTPGQFAQASFYTPFQNGSKATLFGFIYIAVFTTAVTKQLKQNPGLGLKTREKLPKAGIRNPRRNQDTKGELILFWLSLDSKGEQKINTMDEGILTYS